MLYGTFDTVARFRDVPAIYMAKKARIETEFAEYGARYSAHFSHWFDWGTMIYDRFYIDNVPEDPAKALELHDRVWEAGVEESLRHGGTVNEHHGIGLKLGRFMRPQLGTMFDLIKEMRRAWDPQGIMNPGKLGFGPPSSRL
jgi:alkyldihydroxyacetonephosphate synthase